MKQTSIQFDLKDFCETIFKDMDKKMKVVSFSLYMYPVLSSENPGSYSPQIFLEFISFLSHTLIS
jgi:hypothetical protein